MTVTHRSVGPVVSSSNMRRAVQSPKTHMFKPGVGFIDLGVEPQLKANIHPRGRCEAPADARDGSWHVLVPPGGAAPMSFKWLRRQRAWWRLAPHARRVAFDPGHLSGAGWCYGGPANGPHV